MVIISIVLVTLMGDTGMMLYGKLHATCSYTQESKG